MKSNILLSLMAFFVIFSVLSMPVFAYGPYGSTYIRNVNPPQKVVYISGNSGGTFYTIPRSPNVPVVRKQGYTERAYQMRYGTLFTQEHPSDVAHRKLHASQIQKITYQEQKYAAKQRQIEHKLQVSRLSEVQKRAQRLKFNQRWGEYNTQYRKYLNQISYDVHQRYGYYNW